MRLAHALTGYQEDAPHAAAAASPLQDGVQAAGAKPQVVPALQVEQSWLFNPTVLFYEEDQIIAHPCYPLKPFNQNQLHAYVKAQDRPRWMQGGSPFIFMDDQRYLARI